MILSYREKYPDSQDLVRIKSIGVMSLAFIILIIVIGLYIFSFAFVISADEAKNAILHNQTAFMVLQNTSTSTTIISLLTITGLLISITAIISPFLSILSGVKDGLKGVFKNVLDMIGITRFSDKLLNNIIVTTIFIIIWSSVVFHVDIFKLVPFSGPIFGIIGCVIPFILVHKGPRVI